MEDPEQEVGERKEQRGGNQSAVNELNSTANLLGHPGRSSPVPSLHLSFLFQVDQLSFKTLPTAGGEEFLLPHIYQSHPSLSQRSHSQGSREKTLNANMLPVL